ncbi:MAG: M23 family metallopeptidase [Candidatus Cloacimonetes bacterium]|nr:M23 family metallopeptidase [Candidatus Cloacimonadota bacterium]
MKKIIIIFLMFSVSYPAFSQSLDEKKKQLDKLNEKITEEQQLIKEKEEQKKKKEADLQKTQKKKKQADKKIKGLKKSESETKKKLDITIKELEKSGKQLEGLNILCQKEFYELAIAHYQGIIFPEKKIDSHLLASLILGTADMINIAKGQKTDIEKDKKKKNRKYEDIIWSRILTKKKSRKYSKQIGSLEGSITKLDREQQAANERKKQLEAEAAAIDELITKLQSDIMTEHFTYKFSSPKLIWPIKGSIIRGYGEHKSEEYKVSTFNNGIDIAAEEGSGIVAVEDGVVAFAEWYNGAGKLVIIDHQNGFHTLYSHNSTLLVSKGEKILKNQMIALSGKTGSVEYPCVHFELRKRGAPINPLLYLE